MWVREECSEVQTNSINVYTERRASQYHIQLSSAIITYWRSSIPLRILELSNLFSECSLVSTPFIANCNLQLSHRTRSLRVCYHVCVCVTVHIQFSFKLYSDQPQSQEIICLRFVCVRVSTGPQCNNRAAWTNQQTAAVVETRFPMIFQTGYVTQKCRLIFALKFSIVDPIVIRHLAISVSFALAFNTLASPTHFMVLSLSILLRLSLFAFTY